MHICHVHYQRDTLIGAKPSHNDLLTCRTVQRRNGRHSAGTPAEGDVASWLPSAPVILLFIIYLFISPKCNIRHMQDTAVQSKSE